MERSKNNRRKNNAGFTLLEYALGAALIAGIIWVSMSALGQSMSGFFGDLGQWVEDRGEGIRNP